MVDAPALPSSVICANVLVVEDDIDTADLYITALAQVGYGVRKVRSRQEALRVLGNNLYQVIVMDVMMPGPITLDIFMSYRATLFSMSRVVLVSAYPEIENAAKKFGLRFWLKKPFDGERLCKVIREALKSPSP
jgi:DNA-binding NtrC family response regulator